MAVEQLTGNDVIVNIQTGETAGVPTYQLLAYQRGVSYEQAREIIDASHKGNDHAQSVYGRQTSTLSLDGLVPNPEIGAVESHAALYDAMNERKTVMIQYVKRGSTTATSEVKEAEALVGTISEEGPDNDVATFSAEFTLQGPLTLAA